jgi:hypothetical protein
MSSRPAPRRSPAWLVGITYLPFGLYSGFIIVSLQLLLTSRGLAVDNIAILQLVALLPSYTSFLLTPLADCGLPRRTWAVLFAAIAAACLAAGSLLMDKAVAGNATPLALTLLVGAFAAQLYSSTRAASPRPSSTRPTPAPSPPGSTSPTSAGPA